MMRLTDNHHRLPLRVVAPREAGVGAQDGLVNKDEAKRIGSALRLDLDTYARAGNQLLSFLPDAEKRALRDARDQLIVSVTAGTQGELQVDSGNYVGRFVHQGVQFDIRSRFGHAFMQRMLNFANDIFIDDGYVPGEQTVKGLDDARTMLYMLFAQALEKAFLLGLPKSYHSVQHHESAVRGRIDIGRFIRSDMPFRGKVASVSREQRESQPVLDVLAQALRVIETNGGQQLLHRVSHVRAHLKQRKSGKAVSAATLDKARTDKGLLNPIFMPYRRVLALAEMIIRAESTRGQADDNARGVGFLINVAGLFEAYVSKLLARSFPEWRVGSPKILLHKQRFYERQIIPDIVMEHSDGRVAVFDTKYKTMRYQPNRHRAGDVDREDFFQISTYMAYYRQHGELVLGGLLYPLAAEPDLARCHDAWMMGDDIRFIIDGVRAPAEGAEGETATAWQDMLGHERAFVERIKLLLREEI